MRWDDSPGAGFTTDSARPWLPLPPPGTASVASQLADRGSVLWLCRELIALRRAEIGASAGLNLVAGPPALLAYRVGTLLVAANLGTAPVPVPAEAGQVLVRTAGQAGDVLAAGQGLAARLAG